jgi:hypothetical protein
MNASRRLLAHHPQYNRRLAEHRHPASSIWPCGQGTKDGTRYTKRLEICKGDLSSPKWGGDLDKWYEAIEEKFRTIVEDIPAYRKNVDKIVDTAMNLEKLTNIKQFTKLLQKKTPTNYKIDKGR